MLLKLTICAVLKLKACAVKVLHYMKDEHVMNTLHYVPSSITQKIKLKHIFKITLKEKLTIMLLLSPNLKKERETKHERTDTLFSIFQTLKVFPTLNYKFAFVVHRYTLKMSIHEENIWPDIWNYF